MGRLQQKKSQSAKKKAKLKAEKRAAATGNNGGVAVKEGRPKAISLPKKTSGQTRAVSKIQKQNIFQKGIQFLRRSPTEFA